MIVSVIGVGYLGAVHAAAMAELGHDMIGLDVDSGRVAAMQAGRAPFHEPGFEEILRRGLAAGLALLGELPRAGEPVNRLSSPVIAARLAGFLRSGAAYSQSTGSAASVTPR